MGAQLSLSELLKEPQVGLQIIMQLIHPEKFLSWKTDEILPALALPPSYHSCEPSVNALHHLCELRHLRPRSTHCLRGTPAPLSSLQGSLVLKLPGREPRVQGPCIEVSFVFAFPIFSTSSRWPAMYFLPSGTFRMWTAWSCRSTCTL